MNDGHLIELIYMAAFNDDWQSVMSCLAVEGGDISVHMFGHDAKLNRVSLGATAGYDPSFIPSYDSYYHRINAWVPGVARSPVGKATVSEEYCSTDILLKTEFYNDWIRPQGDIGAGGGIILFKDPHRFIIVGGNISFEDRDRKEARWVSLLDRLGPHLCRSFELQRVLQGERMISRAYLDVIEMIGNSVFLVDARGRVQFQNKAADKLFSSKRVFHIDSSGALRLRETKSDQALQAGIAAISKRQLDGYQSVFPIRHNDAARPLLAMLAPFKPDYDKTMVFADFVNEKMPVAILTVHDRVGPKQSFQDISATMFGLTPAEAELAEALCNGITINEYAEQRQTSIHTVRTQLRSVFDKTGARRQTRAWSQLLAN